MYSTFILRTIPIRGCTKAFQRCYIRKWNIYFVVISLFRKLNLGRVYCYENVNVRVCTRRRWSSIVFLLTVDHLPSLNMFGTVTPLLCAIDRLLRHGDMRRGFLRMVGKQVKSPLQRNVAAAGVIEIWRGPEEPEILYLPLFYNNIIL